MNRNDMTICWMDEQPERKKKEDKVVKTVSYQFGFSSIFFGIAWICGLVVIPGYWKILGVFCPPYAWYKFAEKILQFYGVV